MEHWFETRSDASAAAAQHIVAGLERRLTTDDKAAIVVSGGSSPIDCFATLARSELDWSRTHIVLSDERWVSPDDENSNENLIRKHLLVGKAAEAALLPAYRKDMTIEQGREALDTGLRALPTPFACVLLGMGADGHFASLFPDITNLDQSLSVDDDELCIAVETEASPYSRLSLTLSALTQTDDIVLLMFGDEKRDVYQRAKSASSDLPIAQLLRQQRAPVNIYWAP